MLISKDVKNVNGTPNENVHFHYENVFFELHIVLNFDIILQVPINIFCILGHKVTIMHTHFLWSKNLLTQICFNAGVQSIFRVHSRVQE